MVLSFVLDSGVRRAPYSPRRWSEHTVSRAATNAVAK